MISKSGNLYRKARALLMKTTASGCAAGEAAAALEAGYRIVQVNGLSADRLDWPKPPAGYIIRQGDDGSMEVVEKPARSKPRVTKESIDIGVISKPGGATLVEFLATTGWLPHTLRGWASHYNKRPAEKRVGVVTSQRVKGEVKMATRYMMVGYRNATGACCRAVATPRTLRNYGTNRSATPPAAKSTTTIQGGSFHAASSTKPNKASAKSRGLKIALVHTGL